MTEKITLNGDPSIIYFARLHWIIFFLPVMVCILSLLLGYYFDVLRELSYILFACSLLWILATWVTYYFSSLTIQKNHVILRTGVVVRETKDIPISKIESIDIRQSISGSIFQYGALVITGTGGTRQFINYLQKPLTCRRYIEQLLNDH
ncbi:MAG: PH domain-containing protein [Legionella sp.]|nr:PH domain-containing protein [Legionella sp.]